MHCIHQAGSLCSACQADYDEDPKAWLEFGRHAEGEARLEALREEMEAERLAQGPITAHGGEDIPF